MIACQPPGTSISIVVPLPGADSTVSRAADAARPVPHGDQAQVAARPADRRGVEAAAVVGDAAARRRWPRRARVTSTWSAPECRRALCRASWATRSSASSWAAGRARTPRLVEGDPGGVGAVEDLDLGAQGGDQAVLVEGGGAQLDDGGAQFVGGLGGEGGDLLQLALGAGRVAVHEGGGGLGGQPQREELLADGVVQLVGEPGALLGDGELAAALVEPGVGQGDRGVLGEDRQQFLVLLGEAAAALAASGQRLLARKSAPMISSPSAMGRPRKSDMSGWAAGQPSKRGSLRTSASRSGLRLVQHRGEDAVLAGQRADGLPLLVADAVDDELGEAAVVVGDAQRRVLGVEQLAGRGDDRLQDVAHLEMPAHGEQRGLTAARPAPARPPDPLVMGLTVPAPRQGAYRAFRQRFIATRDLVRDLGRGRRDEAPDGAVTSGREIRRHSALLEHTARKYVKSSRCEP